MKLRLSLLIIAMLTAASSFASTFKVVFSFDFKNGSAPNGGLISDSEGLCRQVSQLKHRPVFAGIERCRQEIEYRIRRQTRFQFVHGGYE